MTNFQSHLPMISGLKKLFGVTHRRCQAASSSDSVVAVVTIVDCS
jgi:hypothetical protein